MTPRAMTDCSRIVASCAIDAQVVEVPPFSAEANAVLDMLATTFSVEQARQVRMPAAQAAHSSPTSVATRPWPLQGEEALKGDGHLAWAAVCCRSRPLRRLPTMTSRPLSMYLRNTSGSITSWRRCAITAVGPTLPAVTSSQGGYCTALVCFHVQYHASLLSLCCLYLACSGPGIHSFCVHQ